MKYVYFFGAAQTEGNGQMKNLLGGKGAGLAEMIGLGIPVPAGFTITTEVCTDFNENNGAFPEGLEAEVRQNLAKVQEAMGAQFGDARNPLLLSVRSGARVSMPGMMDTVLNLGLNDTTVEALAKKTNNPRFAYDSCRRFIQMYSDVVMGMEGSAFEKIIDERKERKGVRLDTDLTADDWKDLTKQFRAEVKKHVGKDFPEDPNQQLWEAIRAVFRSWNTRRAGDYRRIQGIPDHWGTAVNVQAMVFGNMGDDCATGVAFTRDPSTGEKKFFGEYLVNAQGEDVVAGIRTPKYINGTDDSLEKIMPEAYNTLVSLYQKLEHHYKDMQDIEFTIQQGKVWMLQTRSGKRTGKAAVRIAVEMAREGLLDEKTAILRVNPSQLDQLLHPAIDPKAKREIIAKGLPASPGAAVGKVVFTADEAQEWAERGEKIILVRLETSPEDIHGMHAAQGVLTVRGGMTCVAGETRILTDRGLIDAEVAFGLLEEGTALRILSLDSRTQRPIWRQIIAAGRKPSQVTTVSVSQTGQSDQNILRLTSDHKMFILKNRKLTKKRLDAVLQDEDFLIAIDQIPPSVEVSTSTSLAYVVGAILSDGYINLKPTKGSVTFIQKPTPEKAEFIAAVEVAFEKAFGVPFSYMRERETDAILKNRRIQGQVQDRICFRREPAVRLAEIRDHLSAWVLTLDRMSLLHFLAGFADGDGTYAEESSAVRLQISVSGAKRHCLEGLALACLRLGILPQITNNREHYTLQIAEKVDAILAFTHRLKADIPERHYESKCLSVKALFEDIVDRVNFMGRIKEGIKRDLMFGVEKIRRDILALCPGETYREVQSVLDAPLRSYRVKQIGNPEESQVYNFEVDASDDLDKNFIVFSSRLTPILVSNSHAAVVARGMGKCCVSGCGDINIDYKNELFKVNGTVIHKGDWLTLDGTSGEVIKGQAATIQPELSGDFGELMTWVDRHRKLKVRTNADTPLDASVALQFGAEGIGLCRTEHMFFEPSRIEAVREMILAENTEARRKALAKILPIQKKDFKDIFREMKGLPVTIRLLDPPLHEFLPQTDADINDLAAKIGVSAEKLKAKSESLHEFNPMLGHRGCRLGITYPEIYQMQVRAIMEAACELAKEEGFKIIPEIMIPLVGHVNELKLMRSDTEKVCQEVIKEKGTSLDYLIGTMIELPRAAMTADEIASQADFFSFGTNDLTQTTFGFSRDDAGKFLPYYVEKGILPFDPFVTLDQAGVGGFIQMSVQKGRGVKPGLKVGICGEHGGDPASVEFCNRIGLDYVSCSPYRVPIARLAAAHAVLKETK